MFHKKYKVKSSTALKGSDRKKLRSSIKSSFPLLSEDELNSLLPPKGELIQIKVFTHSSDTVMVYCRDSNPLFFTIENDVFPTVYTLWKYPRIVPILTTLPNVLEKMCNGADLMAPGVVTDERIASEMNGLQQKQVCSVRLLGNKVPIAVGVAAMSDAEISAEGCKGKAVFIKHCYRDNLWLSGDQSHPPLIPDESLSELSQSLTDADNNQVCSSDLSADDEINRNISEMQITSNNNVDSIANDDDDTVVSNLVSSERSENEVKLNPEEVPDVENSLVPQYTMDDVLNQCFMLGLKLQGKKTQLPILTSTFYKTHVLPYCPEDLKLDIKKTSYKKLSVFLKAMMSDGLVSVKELSKGVESIVAINLEHEKIKGFRPDPKFREHLKKQKEEASIAEESSKETVQDKYRFPEITEMFVVSAQVKALFEHANVRKGDALISSEVKEILREYVKNNGLVDENNPRMVQLDPLLADALLKRGDNKTSMTWEELHEIVLGKMSPAHKVTFEGEQPKVKKGQLEPIDISVATRSGNKKVTLISNLENFGINPEKLANYVQVAVAASTSVGQSSCGKKGTQVLIQGNQLRYLQKLFFEIYKVPRKYVKGLENVPAKKKK